MVATACTRRLRSSRSKSNRCAEGGRSDWAAPFFLSDDAMLPDVSLEPGNVQRPWSQTAMISANISMDLCAKASFLPPSS